MNLDLLLPLICGGHILSDLGLLPKRSSVASASCHASSALWLSSTTASPGRFSLIFAMNLSTSSLLSISAALASAREVGHLCLGRISAVCGHLGTLAA